TCPVHHGGERGGIGGVLASAPLVDGRQGLLYKRHRARCQRCYPWREACKVTWRAGWGKRLRESGGDGGVAECLQHRVLLARHSVSLPYLADLTVEGRSGELGQSCVM
ncbi:unnamed protein product, partial [Scytosiphon promiscuus]